MTKKDAIALMDDFLKTEAVVNMLEFTSSPDYFCDDNDNYGRNGWEKWLQFEFAKFLFKEKYKEISLEDKTKRHRGKNKDKLSNQVDITFSKKYSKNESLNCLEFKVNKSPGMSVSGLLKDIEGIYQIKQTSWKFRSVICVAFFHANKLNKNYKYKKFITEINSKYFHLQKNPVNGWQYLMFCWSDTATNMANNYKNYNVFYKNNYVGIKNKFFV